MSDLLEGILATDDDPSLYEANPWHEQHAITRPREHRTVDGWAFVTAAADTVAACWGEGDTVAWAKGEPLMLVGPDGVGKTSLGQQLALSRLLGGTLLGLPVSPAEGKVLYLAADRPSQAARSMRRMVHAADEDTLRERLIVHRGPPPFDIVRDPAGRSPIGSASLAASDLIIDSLKDLRPSSRRTRPEARSTAHSRSDRYRSRARGHSTTSASSRPEPRRRSGSPTSTAHAGSPPAWAPSSASGVNPATSSSRSHISSNRGGDRPFRRPPRPRPRPHHRPRPHRPRKLLASSRSASTAKTRPDCVLQRRAESERRREGSTPARGAVGRNRAERQDDHDGLGRYSQRHPPDVIPDNAREHRDP